MIICTGIFRSSFLTNMLNVISGNKFPAEKPMVTLRSVSHLHCNKPFIYQLTGYPYSPRWKVDEMINRLLSELVVTAIPKFKIDSQAVKQF